MLEVKDLTKSFGSLKVLKGISFKVDKGEVLVIVGPSGCGKSTLLRCLNLLEKADTGSIKFQRVDITKKNINVNHVREKMGMVFQNFNLFPHLTVLENLTLAPTTLKLMSKESANKEALKLLESIGLLDKKDEYPDNLSGGQKQRVAIIRSLIMKPKIMLFDEPTSALDPEMVSEVFDLIKKLASSGMTLIIVSHEMRFITEVSNHVIFLDDGNIIFDGTKEEMKITKNKRIKDFLKSHKKYFYTMQEYPEDLIILVDDDMFYPYDMIEKLLKLHYKYPQDICTMTAQVIGDDITVVPSKWKNPDLSQKYQHSTKLQIFTGSGSLYPPNSLNAQAFNEEVMKELCPYADDLWLTFMAKLNGTKVTTQYPWRAFPITIYGSGIGSLYYINAEEGQNDIQWKALLNYFKEQLGEVEYE